MKSRQLSFDTFLDFELEPIVKHTNQKIVDACLYQTKNGLSLETAYLAAVSLDYRRKLGQFFTPPTVANFLFDWAVTPQTKTLLDPAVGTGLLIGLAASKTLQIDAYDIDPVLVELVTQRFSPFIRAGMDLKIVNKDFLGFPPTKKYDACVCNPPYIRHHDVKYPIKLWENIEAVSDLRLSRMTNTYTLFMLQICQLLNETGRAAIITPSEYINSDYGKEIKRYLLKENLLEAMIVFDSKTLLFDKALTTACITLIRKGRTNEKVTFVRLENEAQLGTLQKSMATQEWAVSLDRQDFNVKDLKPTEKWGHLFGLVRNPKQILPQPKLVALSKIATPMRGIATGANSFFTLSQSEVAHYGIDMIHLKPCITKAQHIDFFDYTYDDFEKLKQANKKVYLLDINEDVKSLMQIAKYLSRGEALQLHKRYLTSHRPVWYAMEQRPPAPILVNVFNRKDFKVVYNRSNVLNLTAFHCIYPKTKDPNRVKALVSYLIAEQATASIQKNKRTYGDGLDKLEPRDLNDILVPDILSLDANFVTEMAQLFDNLCDAMRCGNAVVNDLKQQLNWLWNEHLNH